MQIRKFIVSIFVVIIAFFVGYGDAIGLIQRHTEGLFSKAKSFFSSEEKTTTNSAPENKAASPAPSSAGKIAKDSRPGQKGLGNMQEPPPQKQEVKRSKYIEDLRERLKESQEEPSDENDQGMMDTNQDSPEGEPEELPPAFTDPYAQFRRPPGQPPEDQPSTFATDNEEVVEEDNTVEEVAPEVEDEVDASPEDAENN